MSDVPEVTALREALKAAHEYIVDYGTADEGMDPAAFEVVEQIERALAASEDDGMTAMEEGYARTVLGEDYDQRGPS